MCSDAQLAREMAKVGNCHHCRNLTSPLTTSSSSLPPSAGIESPGTEHGRVSQGEGEGAV